MAEILPRRPLKADAIFRLSALRLVVIDPALFAMIPLA
jgi:hypothetical protein